MLTVEEIVDLFVDTVEYGRVVLRFVAGQAVHDGQFAMGDEVDDRVAGTGDGHLLSCDDARDQRGELALRLMHIDLGHQIRLAKPG